MTEAFTPSESGSGPPAASLGHSVGRGVTALMTASLLLRMLNFASQAVLGALLFDKDFGIFAIANSVSAFVVVLQDGGLRTLIVQRGDDEYEKLEGPAFWLALVFNVGAAAVLAALAPFVAKLYSEPKLMPMLWIIASSIVLSSLGTVPLARLRMQMRFGALSMIEVLSGAVRYGGMIVGALAGIGPLAFVAALPAVAVLEAVAGYLATRRKPWMRPPERYRWRALLGASGWLVTSSVTGSALYVGFHMALGLTATISLVGLFFFGYSVVQQSGYLIISTTERVLLPVFSRLRGEQERRRVAVVRTLRAVSVLGFSTCAVLGAVFAPVENLIWSGKWAHTVGVVHVMSICYPLFTLHVIARCVITGSGRFRAHAFSVAIAGATLMLVAIATGAVTTDPIVVAWILGIAMAIVSFAYLSWGVADLALSWTDLLAEVMPIALCGAAALLLGIAVDDVAQKIVVARGWDPIAGSLRTRLVSDGLRLAAAAVASTASIVLLLRVFVSRSLLECLQVLPERLGRFPRRLLGF
jgi:PST family polysaccharide transporter